MSYIRRARSWLRAYAYVAVAAALLAGTAVAGPAGAPAAAADPGGPGGPGGAFDAGPARKALARLVPGHQSQVELRALPGGGDQYRISGRTGHIVIEGGSPALLLAGFNTYLKVVTDAGISWNGEQLNLPRKLPAPDAPISRRAEVRHRFAFNDNVSGYSAPYWDWARWEREIDVLALQGVNEVPVYPGADAVYYETFRDFGYSDKEIRDWIPAPAHQPWWLMGNMSGFGGPMSKQLIDRRAALGRRIAGRLRELGMTPVLPGYYGLVPPGFTAKNPGSRVVAQPAWNNLERPDWQDPRTPVFGKVAASFYRHQRALIGSSGMYKMDPWHEDGTPGDVPPGEAGKAMESALRAANPGAIWTVLGWFANPRQELLRAIDRSRMLIVDGMSDLVPEVPDRERDWLGTPYAFGSMFNFGGHTTIGANMPEWTRLFPQWRDKPGSALSGIAMMPEGTENNPAAFSLFTELAWTPGGVDLDGWFDGFARARYGGDDPHARAAWRTLRETAYNTSRADFASAGHDSLFAARPDLSAVQASSSGSPTIRYDAVRFDRALGELLKVAPELRDSSAYRFDVVDIARQTLSNRSRTLLPRIKAAYEARDRERFGELTRLWLRWMKLVDSTVGTDQQFLLGRWTADARAWGATEAERDQLEYDARSLLTLWGPRAGDAALQNYANRDWNGLIGDLYHRRWSLLFADLDGALAENRPPTAFDWYAMEDRWSREHKRFPVRPSGDPYQAALKIHKEVAAHPIG